MIKSTSYIVDKFIWNDKPDKINKQQICKDYLDGGFKMLDLEKFIKSLKLTWIRRLIRDSDSPWAYLVNHQLNRPSNLCTYGVKNQRLKTLFRKMC